MAYRSVGTTSAVFVLLAPGCFNPDPVSVDSDSDPTGSSTGTTTMTSGPTSDTTPTTSPTSTTSPTTVGETEEPTTVADVTGDPPECEGDEDCADVAGECEVATCSAAGTCEVENAAEGTACGDASDSQCDGADTCDGSGACVTNVVSDGVDCTECDGAQCICNAGACEGCVAYADTNLFSTERSLNGWELSGDWGLYSEAPVSRSDLDNAVSPAVPFGNQVLGTDGNRSGPAYPGGHMEFSYARTPPTELPTSLEFQSWHVDEGAGSYDNKIIRISTDGGATWTDIISCVLDPGLAFCQRVETRDADDWDAISLDLPAPLIGQVGIIEFAYDTFDACCSFEKGWYIDVTNFATECACTADEVCESYGTECGAGVCGANGGCNVDPAAAGTACGASDDNTCTAADTCDGFGSCQANDVYPEYGSEPENQFVACDFCDAGDDCVGCSGAVCQDCASLPELETFGFGGGAPVAATFGWDFQAISGGDWQVRTNISNNEDDDGFLFPTNAPFLGIDGSYDGAPGGGAELNDATAVTRSDVFSSVLSFRSWHQDEGGSGVDRKTIEISVDDGMTWIPVADCDMAGALSDFPFCDNVNGRDAEDWDDISIDVATYDGMEGLIRFSYDTVDTCCGFERGWYIDDLNFAQTCDAPLQSAPTAPPCTSWVEEEPCNADQSCGWDAGATACIQCSFLPQAECDLEPVCAWRVSESGAVTCAQAPQ